MRWLVSNCLAVNSASITFKKPFWNMVPVNPPVSTVEVAGPEILRILEEDIERRFSCDLFIQRGAILGRFAA